MNQSLWKRIRSDLSENTVCQHVLREEFEVYHWISDETFAVHTLETLKYNPDEVYAKCPKYQALFDSIKELIRPSTAGQIKRTK